MQNYRKISDSFAFRKLVRGFTIIELLVVMAVIALLVLIAIPAINAMQKSYDSTGAEGMISAALSTARTLAIKNNHYTGVRFQKAWKSTEDPLKAPQYMIFIIFDSEKTNLDCGFIAVEDYKPIKLPENVGVIDKMVRKYIPNSNPKDCGFTLVEDDLIANELDDSVYANLDPDNHNRNITDMSTFSIVFSPSGKLITQEMRCRNKDRASRNSISSDDDIFNTKNRMESVTPPPKGMFLQDDFDDYGIGIENSRREFWIYDRQKFEKMPATGNQRWDYINGLKPVYVNHYTGELIK